jgi:hypothetical protein
VRAHRIGDRNIAPLLITSVLTSSTATPQPRRDEIGELVWHEEASTLQ